MFELGSAVVLGLVVFGLVQLAKKLIAGTNRDRVVVVGCLVVSFIAVMLVAASDFAESQVVLDRSLDTLNFASQLVVVLLLTGLATATFEGFRAVGNIGQNQEPVPAPMPEKRAA